MITMVLSAEKRNASGLLSRTLGVPAEVAYPELLASSVRFIQNDVDELMDMKTVLENLGAGASCSGASRAEYTVPTNAEDTSTFRLPHRPFDDLVKGDPVSIFKWRFRICSTAPTKAQHFIRKIGLGNTFLQRE